MTFAGVSFTRQCSFNETMRHVVCRVFFTSGVQYLDATRFFFDTAPSAWRSLDASFVMFAATAAAALIAACLFSVLAIVNNNCAPDQDPHATRGSEEEIDILS